MIFDLDLKPRSAIALKDDSGSLITYGDLVVTLSTSYEVLQERSLVLILAENTATVVRFILTCFENKWVPIVLNSDLDSTLINRYIDTYRPNAIFGAFKKEDINISAIQSFDWYEYKIHILSTNMVNLNSQLSLLLPTSGSTGSPKLVRHSYQNIQVSAQSVAQFFDLEPNDVGLGILPVFYTMGMSVVISHLQAGACVYLTQYSLTEKGFWEILKNEAISILTGVPYTFEVLFKMRFERVKIPTLRILTQGGGKLSAALWDTLVNYCMSNQVKFIPTYGQTEGTARMSYLEHTLVGEKKGSIGKPIPGGTFEVWDNYGQILKESEAEGELVYKGKNVTLGYAESIDDLILGDERGGILPTGDIVKRDEEGYYYIVGRKKRFLKIYGLRISLDEVELLLKDQFSMDCYASGSDTQLIIFVTDREIIVDIKNWLSNKIDLFHKAIDVRYVETIPRNASGKVIF